MNSMKNPYFVLCDLSGPKGWCLGFGRTRYQCDK